MKVFLDTNVLISAFLGSGLCRDVLRVITDEHNLVVSQLVLNEYLLVLREKFGAGETDLKEALMLILRAEVLPDVSTPIPRGAHRTSDVTIMLTARYANVDLLVTGDHGMLSQAPDLDLTAVSPRGFFQINAQSNDSYPSPSDHDNGFKVSESTSDTTRERAFDFALSIIKLCKVLEGQRHYVLAKQLLRAGTSIGANIEEAGAAQSRRDFLHKMSIASKEARETNYWLRLIQEAEISPTIDFSTYLEDSLTLIRLLTAIVKTTAQTAG